MRTLLLSLVSSFFIFGCWGESQSTDGPQDPAADSDVDPGPNESCRAWEPNPSADAILLESLAASGWQRSVFALQSEAFPGRWYLAEQRGVVSYFDETSQDRAIVYDGRELILSHEDPGGHYKEEQGLLSLALGAPGEDMRLYLAYTVGPNPGALVVGYLTLLSDGTGTVEDAPVEVLRIEQPYSNHNGAHLAFGPDGFLYVGVGDGGSAGDPQNHSQREETLLGAILRIDVSTDPYAIPEDNPLVGLEGRDEIFAWGLRNPWRFHFDSDTGLIWAGDVGQNAYEEIDIIRKGENYGWRVLEGESCYLEPNCDTTGLTPPLLTYPHSEGRSVTGGMVYRGRENPALYGTYIFGDFQSGRIWGVDADYGETRNASKRLLLDSGLSIASFAVDLSGELYVLDLFRGLYRIQTDESDRGSSLNTVPENVSQTGCAHPDNVKEPTAGMLPYTPAQQFWSDGAEKSRFVAIPPESQIALQASGELQFPIGTVTRKDFVLDGHYVETRFFVRSDDGRWRGYSYRWDEVGTEAVYHQGGFIEERFGTDWYYPSEAQCLGCHTEVAGRVLGLEAEQLVASQRLERWESWGYLDRSDWSGRVFVDSTREGSRLDDASFAQQYLHTNCSMCHQPGGGGGGMHLDASVFEYGCDVSPSHGSLNLDQPSIVAPGQPERSVLLERIGVEDSALRMAPGNLRVDDEGLARLRAWIESLENCPETP